MRAEILRFDVGDKVLCLKSARSFGLIEGKIYTIIEKCPEAVTYKVARHDNTELTSSWFDDSRFELHTKMTHFNEELFTL